jgi:hypothetical protein
MRVHDYEYYKRFYPKTLEMVETGYSFSNTKFSSAVISSWINEDAENDINEFYMITDSFENQLMMAELMKNMYLDGKIFDWMKTTERRVSSELIDILTAIDNKKEAA